MSTIPAASQIGPTATVVRRRIEQGGERLWRLEDFRDLPFAAVAQALSRLTRAGSLQRLSKGLYYRARPTAFGTSRPNPAAIERLAAQHQPVFPAGTTAANLLGFTTQNPRRGELATTALSLPRKLVGATTHIHTRRPPAWTQLSASDAALLDFLRRRGQGSELSPADTLRRVITLLGEEGRYERLVQVAPSEPPRVRAMLGALGEHMGQDGRTLAALRATLNPLSRFDFGLLAGLPSARAWQAQGPG